MVNYIENVNKYVSHMKIKQTYISSKTGINTSTLSRILKGTREISISEMEKIARALGKKVEYFLDEKFSLPVIPDPLSMDVVSYVGEPTREQELFANKLIELIDNIDEVLAAESFFMMNMEESIDGDWEI